MNRASPVESGVLASQGVTSATYSNRRSVVRHTSDRDHYGITPRCDRAYFETGLVQSHEIHACVTPRYDGAARAHGQPGRFPQNTRSGSSGIRRDSQFMNPADFRYDLVFDPGQHKGD